MIRVALVMSALWWYKTTASGSGTGTKWPKFNNTLVSNNILKVVEFADSASMCLKECLEDDACVSVFYRRTLRQCQLHDVLFLSEQDGVEDLGTQYYSVTTGICPSGYIHVRKLELCYRIVLEKIAHDQCVADCESRGEHLISIDSQEKQDHVQKQVLASSDASLHNYYIDGSDAEVWGQWKFHDGRVMTYFAWGSGYPANETSAEHVIVMNVRAEPFFWFDTPTSPNKLYMCELDIENTPPNTC